MEQNAASAQSRYEQIRARHRTGQASNLDELSARLDLQTRQTNVRSAVTGYENALDDLKNLLMIPPEENTLLQGDLQSLSMVEEDLKAGIPGESLTISVLRKNINALEAQRKGLRISSYAPVLNLSWNASPLYNSTSSEWFDNNGQFSISLSMKLDNFLPWSQAKEQIDSVSDAIAAQQNRLRESALDHQNTVRTLRRNIARSAKPLMKWRRGLRRRRRRNRRTRRTGGN
jgi:outer membrane protein TolC